MSFGYDLRYALRTLGRAPGVSAVAVLTLALAVGVNAAVFSVMDGMLLRPLPYPDQHRIVFLNESWASRGYERMLLSYADLADWRSSADAFSSMAAYRADRFTLTGRGEPERLAGASVDAELFDVLRMRPLRGRTFQPQEDRPGAAPVILIGEGLWRRRFGGDPAIVGQTLSIDGTPRTVIGVMPHAFDVPERAEIWVPLARRFADDRSIHWLNGVGRLAPAVTLDQARAQLAAVAGRLARQHPDTNAGVSVFMRPLRDELVGDYRRAFLLLMSAVAFLLLIACANVANLMLSRVVARGREFAVRTALGASRWQLTRLLTAEAVLVSAGGGAVGLLLAFWEKRLLVAAAPVDLPRWMVGDIGVPTAWFAAGVSAVSAGALALAPAVQAVRRATRCDLRESGARTTTAPGRLRSAFVVSEVALALVLLVAAGLTWRAFHSLMTVDPGFQVDHALVARVELPDAKYTTEEARRRFAADLVRAVAALPGVRHAATASTLPLAGGANLWGVTVEGAPPSTPGQTPFANSRIVSPDYFQAMGISMRTGRGFTNEDGPGSAHVAIVNETLARKYWPNRDPVGRRLKFGLPGDADQDSWWTTVVGVAADVRHYGLNRAAVAGVYVPEAQTPVRSLWIVARADGDPALQGGPIRQAVRAIDRDLPVTDLMTLATVVERSTWTGRLYAWLFGIFGAMALLLAATGVYGVIAFSVGQRVRELGIRMTLGASGPEVVRLVVGQAMRPALVGIALGVGGALAITPVMASLLFGVTTYDPITYASSAAGLLAVALAACVVPARRAARIDPAVTLRAE